MRRRRASAGEGEPLTFALDTRAEDAVLNFAQCRVLIPPEAVKGAARALEYD